jgi:hypothetical protein
MIESNGIEHAPARPLPRTERALFIGVMTLVATTTVINVAFLIVHVFGWWPRLLDGATRLLAAVVRGGGRGFRPEKERGGLIRDRRGGHVRSRAGSGPFLGPESWTC